MIILPILTSSIIHFLLKVWRIYFPKLGVRGNRVLKKTSSSKGLKSAGLLAVGVAYDLSKLYLGHWLKALSAI